MTQLQRARLFIRKVIDISGRPPQTLTVKVGFRLEWDEAEDLINEVRKEADGTQQQR